MSIFGTVTFAGFNDFGVTSLPTTLTITSGALVIVGLKIDGDPGSPTCTDTSSTNTFTATAKQNAPSNGFWTKFWYVLSANAKASDVITIGSITAAGVTAMGVWNVAISGGTCAFDSQPAIADILTQTSPQNSGTFNTATADEFVASMLGYANQANTWTPGTGYTDDGAPTGNSVTRLWCGHGAFIDGPTTNKVVPWTFTGTKSMSISAISFKTAAVAGGVKNSIMMQGVGQ
jgi:hypothetical protein